MRIVLLGARALDAIATYDRSRLMSSLKLLVTLVAAEHDPVSSPEAMQDLAGRISLPRLRVLPGRRARVGFVDPAVVTDLIREAAATTGRGGF